MLDSHHSHSHISIYLLYTHVWGVIARVGERKPAASERDESGYVRQQASKQLSVFASRKAFLFVLCILQMHNIIRFAVASKLYPLISNLVYSFPLLE